MELEQKAVEIIDKLTNALESAAQPAAEIALRAVQLEGILFTSLGVAFICAGLGIAYFLHVMVTKHHWGGDAYVAAVVSIVIGAFVGTILICKYVIAAFDPAASLALKVLSAVT